MRTAEEAAEAYRLSPDPHEGWSRQTDHAPGRLRAFLYLLGAGSFAAWHRLPADVIWTHEDGGACALSRSPDGMAADAVHLGTAPGLKRWARVPEGHFQALEPLGAWTLLRATYVPDARLTDRALTPEDWFPGRGAP